MFQMHSNRGMTWSKCPLNAHTQPDKRERAGVHKGKGGKRRVKVSITDGERRETPERMSRQ